MKSIQILTEDLVEMKEQTTVRVRVKERSPLAEALRAVLASGEPIQLEGSHAAIPLRVRNSASWMDEGTVVTEFDLVG